MDFYQFNEQVTEADIKKWNILFQLNRQKLISDSSKTFTNKDNPSVFISFTTCKRVDLFQETVNSILNHWEDVDKIDYWFCVDDNSSIDDRVIMYNKYPWMDYVFKTSTEKGHRTSMNIIWNKLNQLKPTYWIHMEDDFLFYDKMNYITESIDLFQQCNENGRDDIKQILFNRNYGETIEGLAIKGHQSLPFTDKLVVHNHCSGSFPYPNCHYWPHYSFRPAMILTDSVLKLGNYDSPNTFFEMDYAKKWYDQGYQSAFFNKLTNRHIGRLTSERNTTKKNAYTLNEENQFGQVESKFETLENPLKNETIKIINLKHREDRREKTKTLMNAHGLAHEFVEAVNGRELILTQEIKNLFKDNDFGNRKGVIGCALSHYNLWKQLIEDKENSYYIIMEDDILSTSEDFGEKMKRDYREYEVLFFGYSMFSKHRKSLKIYNEGKHGIHPLNKTLYIGGFFGYSINKMGAYKLLEYIKVNGIKHGIDYLIKIIPELDSYEMRPQILFSEWNENGKQIDTDIQNNNESFDFSEHLDYTFYPKLDYAGNDLYYKKTTLNEMFKIANNDKKCTAFNTLGFFKHSVDITQLNTSGYFRENDGLYVKNPNCVCFIHCRGGVHEMMTEIEKTGIKIIILNSGEPFESSHKVVQLSDKAFETNYIYNYCETKCSVLYVDESNDWKRLFYFLVERYKDCLTLLEDYDVVGCHPNPHDNFWWATSEYIRKSPLNGVLQPPKYYCLHNSLIPCENYRHIRVKMMCNWCSSYQLCKEWSNMCDYGFVWKNIEMTWEDADYYVIINKPQNNDYDPSKTIVFQMEPWVHDEKKQWGLKTWEEWSEPTNFLRVFGRKTGDVNNVFWQLELPLLELSKSVVKTSEVVSTICSSKYFDEGHIHRIDFLHYLEKEGIRLDIYNQNNERGFRNYRGPLTPYVDKSKGILPYKYYFMVENNYEKDFITEKLWEPILCETLCFYYGCPNVEEHVNPLAYVLLDMYDFEKSAKIIKQAIQEDWWSQRIDVIRQEKQRLLNELAFFPRLRSFLNSIESKKV